MLGRLAACIVAVYLAIVPARSAVEQAADVPTAGDVGIAAAIAPAQIDAAQGPVVKAETPVVAYPILAQPAEAKADDGARIDSKADNRTTAATDSTTVPNVPQAAAQVTTAPVQLASLDPTPPVPPKPQRAEPFGLAAVPLDFGNVLTKWSGVEANIRADDAVLARCRADAATCPQAAKNFLAIIDQGRAQTGRARIGIINRAVNLAIEPMTDMAQWGVPDRWSAPLETFATGRGDCEDYAIAKYVALTAAGVAADDVKLIVVRNTAANEDHAVTAVRLDGGWIVLDNRWLTLVADTAMPQTIPLFVLDEDGVRRFTGPARIGASRAPAPASLP